MVYVEGTLAGAVDLVKLTHVVEVEHLTTSVQIK